MSRVTNNVKLGIQIERSLTSEYLLPSQDMTVLNKVSPNKAHEITIPNWIQKPENLKNIMDGKFEKLMPVTAEFVTTLNCNFRCRQCSYAEPKKTIGIWEKSKFDQDNHMTEQTARIALNKLHKGGVKNILFTGGGEPLYNPITLKAMHYAKKNNFNIALYTNGYLLTEKLVEDIISLDPLFIRVSVYGGDQETVSKYTGMENDNKSFHRVISNIKRIVEKKKKHGSDMNFGLSYLVHPITTKSIKSFAEVIRNIPDVDEIDYIRFTPAVDYFNGEQHNPELMKKAFNFIEEDIMPIFNDTQISVKPYYHRLEDLNKEKEYNTCRASGWFAEVDPAGKMYLCCEKHFIKDYFIGDLKRQTLEEIWNGKKRKKVLEKVNKNLCGDCPTLCKPHELNKIFKSVEDYRKKGKIHVIKSWADTLLQYGKTIRYQPGKLDDFQS